MKNGFKLYPGILFEKKYYLEVFDIVNINLKERILVLAIAFFAMPIHELGHWLGYKFSGVPVIMHYNYTELLNDNLNIWGIAGGPLISLLLAFFALIMVYLNENNKDIWAYFSNIMCLTRFIPYIVLLLMSNNFAENDEGLIAKIMQIPVWLTYLIFIILFISIFFTIIYKFKENFYMHMKKYKYGYILYLILVIFTGIQII